MASPIETALLEALKVIGVEAIATIDTEVLIGTYRADIVLCLWFVSLIVECNGHDWHERTKQQAAYDRARDRELLTQGYVTIRFTGSEIFHSPERCAAETLAVLRSLDDRLDAVEGNAFRDALVPLVHGPMVRIRGVL